MQKIVAVAVLTLAACVLTTRMVRAEGPGPCPTDSVPSGTVCVDKYEASVWETTNAKLVAKIRAGTATLIDLISAGAQQRGVLGDDYGPECPATGNGCTNVYAVSIAGVVPSRFLTWFQAVAAARNSGKRLAASAEWQAAALGTPDPGTDDGSTNCNVQNPLVPVTTGSRSGCVSDVSAFDMVGNLWEWVADWVPLATDCVPSVFPSTSDFNCTAGADTTAGPGALLRGGAGDGPLAGVFATIERLPTDAQAYIGFRAVR
jgi:Sulfatase-modifying factor enzyme 1